MSFSLHKSALVSPGRSALVSRVASRKASSRHASLRGVAPVRAFFNFGQRKQAGGNTQRALELEEELFATVRGASPGKLKQSNEEKLQEIIDEISSMGDRNPVKNAEGEFKLVYSSRPVGPPALTNQRLVFADGEITRAADISALGVNVGSASNTGKITPMGGKSCKVLFTEKEREGIGANLLPSKSSTPDEIVYNFLYLGESTLIATGINTAREGREPLLIICKKAGVEVAPRAAAQAPAEAKAGTKKLGRAGRATIAEREYEEKSKAEEVQSEEAPKKKSSGMSFADFFAPPRYVNEDEEEEEEEEEATPAPAPAPARARGRGRTPPASDVQSSPKKEEEKKEKPFSGSPFASFFAPPRYVDEEDEDEGEAPSAAPARAPARARGRSTQSSSKEDTESKAAALAAKREQAAAERAAAIEKKQEIQAFLKDLQDQVKSAQGESRAASKALKDATKENSTVLREAGAARQLIESAESSVLEVDEEVTSLAQAEKETLDELREAQKELQKLNK